MVKFEELVLSPLAETVCKGTWEQSTNTHDRGERTHERGHGAGIHISYRYDVPRGEARSHDQKETRGQGRN